MSQEQLQRVQQLIAAQRFDEARAILQSIDRPEVPQLLAMLDQMQASAAQTPAQQPSSGQAPVEQPPPPSGEDESPGDFLSRLGQQIQADAPPQPAPQPVRRSATRRMPDGTRVTDRGTYEMLWDCQYCGAKKLLGKTHRFCPNCGAAQNPDSRYFPSDDEKVAVEDHVYVGADVTCPNCDSLNAGNAEFCGNCGAPLTDAARAKTLASETRREGEKFASSGSRDVVQEHFDAEMERVGVKPSPKAGKTRSRRLLPVIIVGLVVLFIGAIVLLTRTKETTVSVTGHSWERTIAIQEYGPVRQGSWCDSMPGGAYNVSRSQRVHHTDQVADGQDCQTVRVDNGDGTYSERESCTTRYRSVDVYADYCDYTIDLWTDSRTARTEGSSLSDTPYWPATNLNCEGVARYGCERERPNGRSEDYDLHLRDSENNKDYRCSVDQSLWQNAPIESRWKLDVGAVLGDPRCGSLARIN